MNLNPCVLNVDEMNKIEKIKIKIYVKLVCSGTPPEKALEIASKASQLLFLEDCMKIKENCNKNYLESKFNKITTCNNLCYDCKEYKDDIILLLRTLKDDTEQDEVIGVFSNKKEVEKAIHKYIKFTLKIENPKFEFEEVKTNGRFKVVEKFGNARLYFQTMQLKMNECY